MERVSKLNPKKTTFSDKLGYIRQ